MKIQFPLLATAACALCLAWPLAAANGRNSWAPENLSGTITMVDPGIHTLVVRSSGVPFDMVITRNTRIESGGRLLNLQDLKQDLHKNVSIRFVPESRGDVARTIQLNG